MKMQPFYSSSGSQTGNTVNTTITYEQVFLPAQIKTAAKIYKKRSVISDLPSQGNTAIILARSLLYEKGQTESVNIKKNTHRGTSWQCW